MSESKIAPDVIEEIRDAVDKLGNECYEDNLPAYRVAPCEAMTGKYPEWEIDRNLEYIHNWSTRLAAASKKLMDLRREHQAELAAYLAAKARQPSS